MNHIKHDDMIADHKTAAHSFISSISICINADNIFRTCIPIAIKHLMRHWREKKKKEANSVVGCYFSNYERKFCSAISL